MMPTLPEKATRHDKHAAAPQQQLEQAIGGEADLMDISAPHFAGAAAVTSRCSRPAAGRFPHFGRFGAKQGAHGRAARRRDVARPLRRRFSRGPRDGL